ncbi:hypothetical protein D9M68_849240 [compost metagenome]
MQPGLSDRRLLQQFGLDPFGIDVASVGRDELVLLAPVQDQKAVFPVSEIASRQPVVDQRRFAEIAKHAGAAHQHFAIIGQA